MPTFTADQAVAAQRALRATLGLGDEEFPLPAFIGMISDEIQQLRDAGHTDEQITAIINDTASASITADDLARFYAPPEQRRPPE